MKFYCRIPFDKELWESLNSEVDVAGQVLQSDDGSYIQVMPVDEFNFMPNVEPVIDILLDCVSQVALGLMVNWLYDKLKNLKSKKIEVNGKTHKIESKEALSKALTTDSD